MSLEGPRSVPLLRPPQVRSAGLRLPLKLPLPATGRHSVAVRQLRPRVRSESAPQRAAAGLRPEGRRLRVRLGPGARGAGPGPRPPEAQGGARQPGALPQAPSRVGRSLCLGLKFRLRLRRRATGTGRGLGYKLYLLFETGMFCAVAGAQVRACRCICGMSLATEAPLSHTGKQYGVQKKWPHRL